MWNPSLRDRFKAEIESQGQVRALEYQVRRRDGHAIWVRESSRVVRDAQGAVLYYEGFVEDITQRKEAEAALRLSQQQLVETSRQIGMAEMATSILHNLGNALNSVNVSATVVAEKVRKSKVVSVPKVAGLMATHAADLGEYLTKDPKGRQIPEFLTQLGDLLVQDQKELVEELGTLKKSTTHANGIIAMQQNYAKTSSQAETVKVQELIEDALLITANSLSRHNIRLTRDYTPDLPEVTVSKHRVLQILINLIRNSVNACDATGSEDKCLTVAASPILGGRGVRIQLRDNGVGMSRSTLDRLFNHGFTTRKDGHGFGLHSASSMAKEMGGSVTGQSDGVGKGATFVLEFPCQPPGAQAKEKPAICPQPAEVPS